MRVMHLLTAAVLAAALALACQTFRPQPQQTFATPEAAMEALLDTIERGARELKTSIDDWFNYSLFHDSQALRDSLS